jgi:hypothetical protein
MALLRLSGFTEYLCVSVVIFGCGKAAMRV